MRSRVHLLLGAFALSVVAIGITAAPALALSPAVATSPASSIAETTATLNGKVNPNGSETKFYFEYGKTTSYGSKTSEVSAGSGTTTLEKSQPISGLTKNTLYHYRIVASNAFGTSQGVDQTFTLIGAPGVQTNSAVPDFPGEAATLNAIVDPNGQATTFQFEYGTSSGVYTKTAPIPAESAGSGYEPKAVSHKVTGLTPGVKYYFRATASNASGKVDGLEASFLAPASALTSPAGTPMGLGAKFRAVGEKEIVIKGLTGEFENSAIIKCKESEFEGEVTETYGPPAIEGSLSKLSFTSCGNSTVFVIHPGVIEFHSTGGGNGEVTSTGAEVTALTHSLFFGTRHCIYVTSGTTIGTFSSSENTGATATLDVTGSVIYQAPTEEGGFCGDKARLEGSYTFTSPDYLDID